MTLPEPAIPISGKLNHLIQVISPFPLPPPPCHHRHLPSIDHQLRRRSCTSAPPTTTTPIALAPTTLFATTHHNHHHLLTATSAVAIHVRHTHTTTTLIAASTPGITVTALLNTIAAAHLEYEAIHRRHPCSPAHHTALRLHVGPKPPNCEIEERRSEGAG
ncbi:hypothetical protein CPC08DRAFT_767854 [Agrocybe pediades]|nr:hypothetical protein CPC08DRAFT_767854 [Agrocybe pediades]